MIFKRHAGLRPGLDFAGMDDAAISPARLHAPLPVWRSTSIDIVTGFAQIPGRGRADRTRTQNNCRHCLPLMSICPVYS